MERPREKLAVCGVHVLSDQELIAILLGSGTPKVPLHQICETLFQGYELVDIAQLELSDLCRIKGIGPAKATILLAAAEFSRRVSSKALVLKDDDACAQYLRELLTDAKQLQYILLLFSHKREFLAFAEAGSVLPDITQLTGLAMKAGAGRMLLGRNGWPDLSNTEGRYLQQLQTACAALNIICEGLMAVSPERFKMI